MLPATLPDGEGDFRGTLGFYHPDVHVDVSDILDKGAFPTLDGDDTGLDGNLNTFGDVKFFC